MIQLGRLGRGLPAVVPGPEPEVSDGAPCALCGASDGERMFTVVGHADTVVCVDSRACVLRAVGGVTV